MGKQINEMNDELFSTIPYINGCLIVKYLGFDEQDIVVPTIINGKSVVGLDKDVFRKANNLNSVVIPDGIETIGSGCFFQCNNLVSITLPNTIKAIGERAFSETSIHSISLPDSLVCLGRYAFCSTPLESIHISNSLRFVPTAAFKDCNNLKHVAIPEGVETIDSSAFEGCKNLTHLALSAGLREIKEEAFCNCTSLYEVDIPYTVNYINRTAFSKKYIVQPDRRYNPWYEYDNLPVVITCKPGSTAQEYARHNGLSMKKSSLFYPESYKTNNPIYVFERQWGTKNEAISPELIAQIIKQNQSLIQEAYRIDNSHYCIVTNNADTKLNIDYSLFPFFSRY